jgi:hypothetical protein
VKTSIFVLVAAGAAAIGPLVACSSPGGTGTLTNGGRPIGPGGGQYFDASDPAPTAQTDNPDAGPGPQPLPDGGPAPKWSYMYTTYFGPNSLGHCGNSGCHDKINNHFICPPDPTQCWQGLVDGNWINTTDPMSSQLGNYNQTPLSWFNSGGNMPKDAVRANQTATDEVSAWIYDGAKND